jgi:hypothetical protein
MSRTTTRITNFTGMSPDIRSSSGFARIQHFKVFPHKLVQQFNTEADEIKASNMVRFIYAPWLSTTSFALFGYSVVSTNRPAIMIKGTTTGNIIDDPWGTPAASQDAAAGPRDTRVFFYYKGYFYGFANGTRLWRYGKIDDISGPAWTDTYQSLSYTNIAQPVHHPADDCAYFFVDNKVYRLNNTTWDGLVLTLPDNMVIMSGEAEGNFLHIACKSTSGLGNSISYQWDRDSSLSTLTAKYDWGRGSIIHIANLQGTIVGLMDYFVNSFYAHNNGKLVIKAIVGGQVKTIDEFSCSSTSFFEGNKFVADDKLHFPFELARDGSYIHGIFSVDALGQLRIEVSEAETDAITAGLRYQGIYKTGEYWWIAHSNDGSVNRTDDQSTYTYTSILETNIISGSTQQSLVGARIPCEPLPSGGSILLKYRKVGDTSWTTVSPTKAIATGDTAIHFVKDANSKPPRGDELQYRLESTGGAVIVASPEAPIEFLHETDDQKPYGRS